MLRRIPLGTIKRFAGFNGHVIYRGPSLIDGGPIVAIITGLVNQSRNEKTGDMAQSYILRGDRTPLEALASGADVSVCGNCPHRPSEGRQTGTCYVNAGQGPAAVYDAWHRGNYPDAAPEEIALRLEGRILRMGSYGDPAATPASVWRAASMRAAGHTGYTHQWREPRVREGYREFLMASVDSETEIRRAHAEGWRTFRVKSEEDARLAGEIVCPASAEAGKRLTCAECGACDGAGRNAGRASVVIDAHGLKWKIAKFRKDRGLTIMRLDA